VKVVLLHANQNIVVSGSRDTKIMVWDAGSGKCRATLAGHPGRISGLKVFDNLLVSSCTKRMVKVWDLNTDSCLHSIETQSTAVVDVALNYNHTRLAVGCREGFVEIWNIEKGSVSAPMFDPLPVALINTEMRHCLLVLRIRTLHSSSQTRQGILYCPLRPTGPRDHGAGHLEILPLSWTTLT
jgi:WD40 repeat protein